MFNKVKRNILTSRDGGITWKHYSRVKQWFLGFKISPFVNYKKKYQEAQEQIDKFEKALYDAAVYNYNTYTPLGRILCPTRINIYNPHGMKYGIPRGSDLEVQEWLLDIVEDYQEQLDDKEVVKDEINDGRWTTLDGRVLKMAPVGYHIHPAEDTECHHTPYIGSDK